VSNSGALQDAVAKHRMPGSYFAELSAGRGDSAVIRYLRKTERSRRLVALGLLFEEAENSTHLPPQLRHASEARHVLAQAQSGARDETDRLLLHPQVGGWASYALRRRGAREAGRADVADAASGEAGVAAWVDLGGLFTLAFVAAALAGLSWRTSLPHRDGRVRLFGLGMARFPGLAADALVEAETVSGRITLRAGGMEVVVPQSPHQDGDGWWGLRHLSVGDDVRLTVALDDLDPFRDLADPVEPDRLSDAQVEEWRVLLEGAWDILCRHHRDTAEAMAAGVVSLAPLPLGDGLETRSASSGESFGSIMVSPPPDAVTLAVSLVHEFNHIKLGGLMHLMKLTEDDETATMPSSSSS